MARISPKIKSDRLLTTVSGSFAANALLIYSQYPQATQLKDFDDWGKDNVKITKGAKSISILEPVEYTRADGSPGISYNVKKVFDVTQTNGRKAPHGFLSALWKPVPPEYG